MENLLIVGAGGFGNVVFETAEILNKFDVISFIDDMSNKKNVIGKCSEYNKFIDDYKYAYPAFGDNQLRLDWIYKLNSSGFKVPALVHPKAYVSRSAKLGDGAIVLPNAVVHTNSILGLGCIINIGVMVDHDTTLGDGAHICVGANIKARCQIGKCVKIDAGKTIKEDTIIESE